VIISKYKLVSLEKCGKAEAPHCYFYRDKPS
jgi:hypothetical protein